MKKILLIGGSLNMTQMTHAVAKHLWDDYECHFTPFFADGLYDWGARHGLADFTALAGRFRKMTEEYLRDNNLSVDWRGATHGPYDLFVTTSDLLVPKAIRNKNVILIQEGMTDPENWVYHLVRRLRLPRYLASTSTNGLSQQYNYFCVASEGYRDFFQSKGIAEEKLVVTGIPNFDNAAQYLDNDFPFKNYVLVATSDARETFKRDNRPAFIRDCVEIANGRPLIFKLHPNENVKRATAEIHQHAPGSLIYADGDINPMIANCDVLICQYSTVVYTGLALGKEVHSYFDVDMLREMMPLQNGGTSGRNIAEVCRRLLNEEPVPQRVCLDRNLQYA